MSARIKQLFAATVLTVFVKACPSKDPQTQGAIMKRQL